jgi:two-component system cell cycle sensor histidine kinase/response regulator CckA
VELRPPARSSTGGPTADAYGLLFDQADNMVCTLDLEGRFTAVNAAGEALTGRREAELLGTFAVELIAPELRKAAVERFAKRLETGDRAADETVLVTLDGQRVPIEIASSLFYVDGRPAGVLGLVHDLTERKRAEEALLQSERRFRSSFESAPIGMALVSPEGRFIEVNEALCEIVGYSTEELVARTFQEITHPDDLELDLEYARQMLAGDRRTYQMEKRYFHKDGALVWILLSVSLVRASDGSPLHFISQIQDITDRKRAHQALEHSKAELAEAQQIAHIGSWAHDFASGESSWSDELYRIFAFDLAGPTLTGERVLERVHPDDLAFLEEAAARLRETGEPLAVEYRAVLPDGSLRWVHGRGELVTENGVGVGVRGTAQDITERKEAEQQLAEAEHRYRTLIEQLPLGTYVRPLDMSQPNIYASPQVEPMLGYTAAEWEANPGLFASIVHPEDRDRVLGEAERMRQTGEPLRDEYRYIARDGRTVWVQDETYVACDEDGKPAFVQGFLLDITQRKVAETERDRLRDELHSAQKLEAIGRLAGGVAHDFNNMLTAIKGYSELLLDGLDPRGAQHSQAQQIQRAAEQASALPKQLLAFGRKQALAPRVVDLNGVVAAASDLLKHLITEAVELVTQPSAGVPSAFVDPTQFEHVLVNLALNARAAMPDGGTLTIATDNVELGADAAVERGVTPGSYVVVSVTDTGEGMDSETKERAFEPFFTTRPQGEGTGLGLASVYGTVTQSGGFIELTTAPGQGSTFEIHFPCDGPAVSSSETVPAGQPAARKTTALVAEDEVIVRDLAANVLELAGMEVHVASNGEEALELYHRMIDSIDVLVTDMVMPGVGGRELAERIRELNPELPIVFMSGYTEDAPPTWIDSSTFLQKPFSARDLGAKIHEVLVPSENVDAPRVTCVVADDHPAVLDSICQFLEARGFDVSRAADGGDALRLIEAERPSIALLDVGMAPLGGIEVARQAVLASPETRSVLYTGHGDRGVLEQAMEAGARGFVLKEAPLAELERALTIVAGGGTYTDPHLAGAPATKQEVAGLVSLTPREREILGLVADGMTNDKVGAALDISPETVQSHVRNSMVKLEADTRTEAVATALRHSLIS